MSIKYRVTEVLNLEPDILAGTILVNLYDGRYARIENFRSIIEFGPKRIKFQGKNTRIVVEGEFLEIIQYTCVECNIKGRIHSISYE